MNEDTKESYRKLAAYHYKKINGQAYYSNVKTYLETIALYLSTDYFRRLRNAIAFDQMEKGFKKNAKEINSIKNPVTSQSKKNKEQSSFVKKRVKHINATDMKKINQALIEKGDKTLISIVNICKNITCRPAEIMDIKLLNNNCIHIQGAKKTDEGTRGLDRTINLHPELFIRVKKWLTTIQLEAQNDKKFSIDKYRSRFNYLMKKLFPRRKKWACFYTYRHMLGSKLKASSFNRFQIAYLMGHQSTASIRVYGNKKYYSNSGSPVQMHIQPTISTDKIKTLVRDKKTNFKKLSLKKEKTNNKKQSRNYDKSLGL